jgi:hypothetical protein
MDSIKVVLYVHLSVHLMHLVSLLTVQKMERWPKVV